MKVQLHESNQKMKVNFGQVQMSGGDPGFSPIVDLTETDTGVDITVTDAEGVKRATVRNGRDGEDGYTPEKGKDYFDGQDGFSPVVAVQDISGGHRVTITDKDGEKAFNVMDGKDGEGVGGSAIVDVIELPAENINEDVFYRLLTASFVYLQEVQNRWTCYCVDSLPETGEAAFSGDLSNTATVYVTAYYNVSDNGVYAYVTSMLAGMFGVPAGWYPIAVLMQAVGFSFGGVITNIADDPNDSVFRVLLEYVVWQYKDVWTALKPIGRAGTGAAAEAFNHPSNIASGGTSHAEGNRTTASDDCSHAEGYYTTASGASSHAEGNHTTASGENSHAEGHITTASGEGSHAEGYSTTASGEGSHAEGYSTTASGENSHAEGYSTTAEGRIGHAEGYSTTASGESSHAEGYGTEVYGEGGHAEGWFTVSNGSAQHVQGRFNTEDTSYPDGRGFLKYAHIVGNGASTANRSNAYTLDWSGNGWFAGTVESKGILLTSPNGTKYKITVADDGTLTATAAE